MSLSNKELLQKIKDEVAKEWFAKGWSVIDQDHPEAKWSNLSNPCELTLGGDSDLMTIVCERYATEKAKEAVRASERLRVQDAASAINEANSLRSKMEEQELIIHGITEGADEWKSKCADIERDKAKMFTRSEVESCIKDSLEAAAENAKTKFISGTRKTDNSRIEEIIDKSSITDTKNIKIK